MIFSRTIFKPFLAASVDNDEVTVPVVDDATTIDDDKTACIQAQDDVAATTNAIEKIEKLANCESECAPFDDETCGFLANGLSFVLFAILAIFKC